MKQPVLPRLNSCAHHKGCCTDVLYSSMVPGILPSQLEILSMGQTSFETTRVHELDKNSCMKA